MEYMDKKVKERLDTMVYEFRRLSDKRPNDSVNKFKIEIINKLIEETKEVLHGAEPVPGFTQFDVDELPSNSDVLIVLSLYQDLLQ